MTELRLLVFMLVCLLFPSSESLQLGGRLRRPSSPGVHANRWQPLSAPSVSRTLGHWFATIRSGSSSPGFDAGNATASAMEQAAEYRRRAQQLKAEAASLELSLEVAKMQASRRKAAEITSWMETLFENDRPRTAAAVARILKENRFSESQISTLLEALYKKAKTSQHSAESSTNTSSVNVAMDPSILPYIQLLLDASLIMDTETENSTDGSRRWSGRSHSTFQSQLKEWDRREEAEFQRRLAEISFQQKEQLKTNGTATTPSFRVTGDNITDEAPTPIVPRWIPDGLVSEIGLLANTTLNRADVTLIQNCVLQRSKFFCTSVDTVSNAAVFTGNLRGNAEPNNIDPDLANSTFSEIQSLMKEEKGLSDRVNLFFFQDVQMQLKVLAVPKVPVQSNDRSPLLYVVATVASIATTLGFALKSYSLNPHFYSSIVLDHDLSVVRSCWPVLCGLLTIHAVHETAHHLVARSRGLKVSWPLFIPSTKLGLLGCSTSLKSFPKNRKTLLDFALSGPVTSLLLSIFFMWVGCSRTVRASEATLLEYPFVTAGSLRSSFLARSILTCVVPKLAVMPMSQPIPVHPLVVTGWAGMIASALRLMPILRFDGGRACTAVMGSRFTAVATAWTSLMLLSLGPKSGVWAFIVVMLHWRTEINALDGVTPVGRIRLALWAASVAVAAAVLLPFQSSPAI